MPFTLTTENFQKLKGFSPDENVIGFFDSLARFCNEKATPDFFDFLSITLNSTLSYDSTQSLDTLDTLIGKYIHSLIKGCKSKKEFAPLFCQLSTEIFNVPITEVKFRGPEFADYMNSLVEQLGFNLGKYTCTRAATKYVFSKKKKHDMTAPLFMTESGEQLTGAQLFVKNDEINAPVVVKTFVLTSAFITALQNGDLVRKFNAMMSKTTSAGYSFVGQQNLIDSIESFSSNIDKLNDPDFSSEEARENLCKVLFDIFSILCEQFKVVYDQVVRELPNNDALDYKAMTLELKKYQSRLLSPKKAWSTFIESYEYLLGVIPAIKEQDPKQLTSVLDSTKKGYNNLVWTTPPTEFDGTLVETFLYHGAYLTKTLSSVGTFFSETSTLTEFEHHIKRVEECADCLISIFDDLKNAAENKDNTILDRLNEWLEACRNTFQEFGCDKTNSEEIFSSFDDLEQAITDFLLQQSLKMSFDENADQSSQNEVIRALEVASITLQNRFESTCRLVEAYEINREPTPEFMSETITFLKKTQNQIAPQEHISATINAYRAHASRIYTLLSVPPNLGLTHADDIENFIPITVAWTEDNFNPHSQYVALIKTFLKKVFFDANSKLNTELTNNPSSEMVQHSLDIIDAINVFYHFAFSETISDANKADQDRPNPFSIEGNHSDALNTLFSDFEKPPFSEAAQEKLGGTKNVLPKPAFTLNIFDSPPPLNLLEDLKSLTQKYANEIKKLWQFNAKDCQKAIGLFLHIHAIYKTLPKEVDADVMYQMYRNLHDAHLLVIDHLETIIKKSEKDGFFLLDLNKQAKRMKVALGELIVSIATKETVREIKPDSQPGETSAKKVLAEKRAERKQRENGHHFCLFKPANAKVTHSQQPSLGFRRR